MVLSGEVDRLRLSPGVFLKTCNVLKSSEITAHAGTGPVYRVLWYANVTRVTSQRKGVDFHCRVIFLCVYNRLVNFTRVNEIETLYGRSCEYLKAVPRSTFTFTRGLLYFASISFTPRGKITRQWKPTLTLLTLRN